MKTDFSHERVTEAARRYLAAIDSEPEKDIWDTWDGKPAEGASRSASDWSWADHGRKVEICLSDLRAALATAAEGKEMGLTELEKELLSALKVAKLWTDPEWVAWETVCKAIASADRAATASEGNNDD